MLADAHAHSTTIWASLTLIFFCEVLEHLKMALARTGRGQRVGRSGSALVPSSTLISSASPVLLVVTLAVGALGRGRQRRER